MSFLERVDAVQRAINEGLTMNEIRERGIGRSADGTHQVVHDEWTLGEASRYLNGEDDE